MATKKEKHSEAVAKRERWVAEQQASGLKAQQDDHKNREDRLRDAAREKHDKNHSWKKIDRDCILCQDLLRSQREKGHI